MIQYSLFLLTKFCNRCKQEKSIDYFGNLARSKDGKNCYCKICQQAFRKSWVERNSEKQKRASKEWREKNIERVRATERANYNTNKERYTEKRKRMYEKHIEKRLEYAKRIKKENREYHSQLQRLREAKCRKAFPKWANKKIMNQIYRQAKDMQKEDGVLRHVDHIIPLQHPMVSGLHCEFNLQILTAKENGEKKNKFNPGTYIHILPTATP